MDWFWSPSYNRASLGWIDGNRWTGLLLNGVQPESSLPPSIGYTFTPARTSTCITWSMNRLGVITIDPRLGGIGWHLTTTWPLPRYRHPRTIGGSYPITFSYKHRDGWYSSREGVFTFSLYCLTGLTVPDDLGLWYIREPRWMDRLRDEIECYPTATEGTETLINLYSLFI